MASDLSFVEYVRDQMQLEDRVLMASAHTLWRFR